MAEPEIRARTRTDPAQAGRYQRPPERGARIPSAGDVLACRWPDTRIQDARTGLQIDNREMRTIATPDGDFTYVHRAPGPKRRLVVCVDTKPNDPRGFVLVVMYMTSLGNDARRLDDPRSQHRPLRDEVMLRADDGTRPPGLHADSRVLPNHREIVFDRTYFVPGPDGTAMIDRVDDAHLAECRRLLNVSRNREATQEGAARRHAAPPAPARPPVPRSRRAEPVIA